MYTIEDYYALPEGIRVELIDGVFYDMPSPSYVHQMIQGCIFTAIYHYIREKKGKCLVFMAPADVQLDCDDKTMVQPDVLIICDKGKIKERCAMGAPDFVAEILSDSTRKKDMTVKLRKYKNAGVREYWLIDEKNDSVVVYNFEKNDMPVLYGFDSKIPVGIYQGDLEIDFAEIKKEVGSLY